MVAIPAAPGGLLKRELTTLDRMKLARRWLLWREVPSGAPGVKPKKIPYYADGGVREGVDHRLDTPGDVARLVDYEAAINKVREMKGTVRPYTGMGFALGPDGAGGFWQGRDVDGSLEGAEGFPGYVETSPSGAGWHSIGYGRGFMAKAAKAGDQGEEWYSAGRYFTFTGRQISDGPLVDLYDMAGTGPLPEPSEVIRRPRETLSEVQLGDLRSALSHLDADPYETWARVALALQNVEGGLGIFLEWSRRSPKHKDAEATRKFEGVGLPLAPWKAVLSWAKEAGWDPRERPSFELAARALEVDFGAPQHIEFVLDGFVAAGTVVVAGAAGVGKSSILLGMALTVAHLAKVEGLERPFLRRRVYFITEDPDQVKRIIRGMKLADQLTCSVRELNAWFKLIPSLRADPEQWRKALAAMMEAEEVDPYLEDRNYRPAPLVVFDTVPANVEIENENDNALVSQAVAAIRTGAGRASVWAVTHISKAQKWSEADEMSARGAGAWAGDTQGEIFVYYPQRATPEDPPPATRLVQLGKRRFEAEHVLFEVETSVSQEEVGTPWGQKQTALYRTTSSFKPRTLEERAEEVKERRSSRREGDDQGRMMAAVARFKGMLAGAEGQGLAVSRTRGTPGPLPGAWQRFSWDDLLKGVGGKGEFRARFIDTVVQNFNPREEGSYHLFPKPTFGAGRTNDVS